MQGERKGRYERGRGCGKSEEEGKRGIKERKVAREKMEARLGMEEGKAVGKGRKARRVLRKSRR